MSSRKISLERIGEYLKNCIDYLHNNKNSNSRKVTQYIESQLGELSDYELEKYSSGSIRWKTVFTFWTIGLVKGGYLKKIKSVWYLTDKGETLIDKTGMDLVKISRESYRAWNEKEWLRAESETNEDGFVPMKELDYSTNAPISNMKIKPDELDFQSILSDVEKSRIQIPPFQRDFVWTAKSIVDLLDSIYRGYPIGSFIFWSTSKRLPHHRKIGGLDLKDAVEHEKINYVLDGQQRITSLYAAVKGAIIEGSQYKFYFDLNIGKFDYTKITDKRGMKRSQADPLRVPLENIFLDSTEYLKCVQKYPEDYQNILHNLRDRFSQYKFSIITVWEPDEDEKDDLKKIVNIFSRINDTGKRLTVVAKMVAKCWGENFDLRGKLNLLYDNDLEEIREEIMLQCASVLLNNKKSRTRNILDDTDIDELREKWSDIEKAFLLSIEFLQNSIRIRNLRYLPFEGIIVPLSYFFYQQQNPTKEQHRILERWFWSACLSNRFSSTVESKIEEDCILFDRVLNGEVVENFGYPIDWDTFRTRLINQKYREGNALCLSVLCLYSYHSPKDFKTGASVDIAKSFTNYSKLNLHHIFPRAFLREHSDDDVELTDSVVNIAFAPMITNLEMDKRAPSDYIICFSEGNDSYDHVLSSHLIGDIDAFGIRQDDYQIFLEKRAREIENAFRSKVGLRNKLEDDFEREPSTPIDEIEKGLRRIIHSICQSNFGQGYWKMTIPGDVQDSASRIIEQYLKKHPYDRDEMSDPFQRLNFLNIMDYPKIILNNWDVFKDIFSSKEVLLKHSIALSEYRNMIKHNKLWNEVDKKNGEAAVLWFHEILENNRGTN